MMHLFSLCLEQVTVASKLQLAYKRWPVIYSIFDQTTLCCAFKPVLLIFISLWLYFYVILMLQRFKFFTQFASSYSRIKCIANASTMSI